MAVSEFTRYAASVHWSKLGLAMRQFLLMRIDAHQMRIDAHQMRIDAHEPHH